MELLNLWFIIDKFLLILLFCADHFFQILRKFGTFLFKPISLFLQFFGLFLKFFHLINLLLQTSTVIFCYLMLLLCKLELFCNTILFRSRHSSSLRCLIKLLCCLFCDNLKLSGCLARCFFHVLSVLFFFFHLWESSFLVSGSFILLHPLFFQCFN